MNNYCMFYIVRHAQSEANITHIISGHTDYPLTHVGKLQATKRGKELRNIHFDAVFSSDLQRARETAELIIAQRELIINETKDLRERNQEGFQGKSYSELDKKLKKLLVEYNAMNYEERFSYKFVPNMESDEEVVVRFTTFIRKTAQEFPGKIVLLVCHGNMMRTLLVHLGLGTHQEFSRGTAKNTGYFVLRSDGVDFEVVKTVGIEKKQG